MPPSSAKPAEAGFTLVEVLVALVVSGLSLAMIFAAVGLASSRERVVREQARALSFATSTAERFMAAPFDEGRREGSIEDLNWRTDESAMMRDPRGLMVLAGITIEVHNRDGQRLIRLHRRKLKPLAAP